jgi:hypothetical protein
MSGGPPDRRAKARDEFRKEVDDALDKADAGFRVDYASALAGLQGLTESDVRAICPEPTCMETYDELLAVVQDATRQNLAQAELRNRIRGLGAVALRIAGRIPQLTKLLV